MIVIELPDDISLCILSSSLVSFSRRLRDDAGRHSAGESRRVPRIQAEPPGDYFIGRRYYKPDYHFWGYVRRPGQPWSTAQLVMLNENQKLAPDREQINFGFDNNYEYKLYGRFSGDKVYEPASNGVYPEFVLKGYELISTNPAPIFKSQYRGSGDNRYQIEKPE